MVGPLSFGDILLIVLAFISGMLALYRGLTREVLSLVAWAAAAGAALYFKLYHGGVADELAKMIGVPSVVSLVAIAALIFLVVLVVVHLITMRISDAILDRQLGMVDRILGFLFGLARAFILVVIPYMFYESFVPKPEDQFEWVARSKSMGYVKATSDALKIVLLRAVETYYPGANDDPAAPNQQGNLERGEKYGQARNGKARNGQVRLGAKPIAGSGDQLWRLVKADGRTHQFVVRADRLR